MKPLADELKRLAEALDKFPILLPKKKGLKFLKDFIRDDKIKSPKRRNAMNIGLDKRELYKLSLFADTEVVSKEILFGDTKKKSIDTEELYYKVIPRLIDKNIELILANNERILEQLKQLGISNEKGGRQPPSS